MIIRSCCLFRYLMYLALGIKSRPFLKTTWTGHMHIVLKVQYIWFVRPIRCKFQSGAVFSGTPCNFICFWQLTSLLTYSLTLTICRGAFAPKQYNQGNPDNIDTANHPTKPYGKWKRIHGSQTISDCWYPPKQLDPPACVVSILTYLNVYKMFNPIANIVSGPE